MDYLKSAITLLFIALIIALLGLINNLISVNAITGAAPSPQQSAPSQVVVRSFFSVAKSDALALIDFGSIDILNVTNINASANYASLDLGQGNGTLYNITVSLDSNVHIDLCINGSHLVIDPPGPEFIHVNNYSFTTNPLGFKSVNNFTIPRDQNSEIPLTLIFQDGEQDISPGQTTNFRFFLDLPPGQPPGTYKNIIEFKGGPAGSTC